MTRLVQAASFPLLMRHEGRHTAVSQSDGVALFERFLSGDDDAFVLLYREHHVRLHTYCLKILGAPAQADDMTQEIWERVIRMRGDRPRIRNVAAFLVRMARNLCLDHLKSQRRLSPLDLLPESSHPVELPVELSEREEVVLAALEMLSFDYREVLVLNIYCGYRFDEIAAMLDRSPEAIWARASRARIQLRRLVVRALDDLDAAERRESATSQESPR